MFPDSTVPLTVMVPAASPVVPLPKFTASVVASVERVVMLAPGVAVPAPEVLHWLRVGSDQVPPAVPKPAAVPLLSH
jgi:hypothetical protein